MMKNLTSILLVALIASVCAAVEVSVKSGPVNFWFLDCQSAFCVELDQTKHLDASDDYIDIDIPSKPNMNLFVQCLKMDGECSVFYRTAMWEKTVTIPFGESATFAAANTRQSLGAIMSPSFYNQAGDVEVTLQFVTVLPASDEMENEAVELTANDLSIKNGLIMGDIIKVDENNYKFTVSPSSENASFAVILRRDLTSIRGLALSSGVISGCIFDNETPYLVNTQFVYNMLEEKEEKTLVLSLNEAVMVVSTSSMVVSTEAKKGYINSYEVKVKGTGIATVVFVDRAGNEFVFELQVVFDAESPLKQVNSIPLNTTIPLNGRVELVFNHAVNVAEQVKKIQLIQETMLDLNMDDERLMRVEDNRVMLFFDEAMMKEGELTMQIPAGAFVSAAGKESEEILMNMWVSGKKCNTSYVVNGMRGEKCKCFNVGDRCQCTCGETHFSREF